MENRRGQKTKRKDAVFKGVKISPNGELYADPREPGGGPGSGLQREEEERTTRLRKTKENITNATRQERKKGMKRHKTAVSPEPHFYICCRLEGWGKKKDRAKTAGDVTSSFSMGRGRRTEKNVSKRLKKADLGNLTQPTKVVLRWGKLGLGS